MSPGRGRWAWMSGCTAVLEPMARVMRLRMGEVAAWTAVICPARSCSSTKEWSRVSWERVPSRKR